jgi:DNA polymerase-1
MIRFPSGGILIEDADDLPTVPDHISQLFADFETTSGDPRETATNPWYKCQAIGVAVSFGLDAPVFFVPKHRMTMGWWRDVCHNSDEWINSNVKYDAHVSKNDLMTDPPSKMRCLLTGAKLVDSDRTFKGGYGLDVLSKDWLGEDISEYEWRMQPYLHRNKDYGQIPLDVLAEYACADVAAAKKLHLYLQRFIPEESQEVWATERRMTKQLFEIEQRGVRVDPQQLKITAYKTMHRLCVLDEELEKLVGRSFRPSQNKDCYDVLCAQYGLPVLEWTEGGEPSFDKAALAKYAVHPDRPPGVIERVREYRKLDTFNNLFLKQWDVLNVDGVMHPTYNQCLRTGRMGCSEPNIQQLSEMAKELIVPRQGYGLVQADWSQIEFRFIAHYIENPRWIDAYNRDPWTDAHVWVAEVCGTRRKPAKTINFMMGFGAGKNKTIAVLSVNDEIVSEVIAGVNAMDLRPEARQSEIARACERKALWVYDTYHRALPELKPTSRAAMQACVRRGYARNHYGRRRHLPAKAAHVAFNAVCQSSAADLMKERLVAVSEEVPELEQLAIVHDQVVGEAPLELLERDDELLKRVVQTMNEPSRPLRVPIRTSVGWSPLNWKHAQSDERERKFF